MYINRGPTVAVLATCRDYAVGNIPIVEAWCGKKSKGRSAGIDISEIGGIPWEASRFPGSCAGLAQVGGDEVAPYPGRGRLPSE
jgi:hypothetical protein